MDSESKRPQKKKRVIWSMEAVKYLLELWKENKPRMESTKRAGPIYEEMSMKLRKGGYNFSADEIKGKLHNLSNKYKAERTKLRSGHNFEGEWDLYNALDYLLGNNRKYEWKSLLDEYTDPLYESRQSVDSEAETETEDPILKVELEDHMSPQQPPFEKTSNVAASDMENFEVESDNETLSKLKNLKSSRRDSDTNARVSSNFRIIGDRSTRRLKIFDPDRNNSFRKNVWALPLTQLKRNDKPSVETLTEARLELIQLQKESTKQEMEYRKEEFEQKTREHKQRMRITQKEHEFRMKLMQSNLENALDEVA
ncbi:uncharacterized protein LOC101456420 [Ceratitis capitata]|uniref:(Mediterranean fruit fly) hypothetical protein n=1 Tax=Ceratitis capitata TaxID=7213 RepID=W8C967_CERCA|nr:uncharacterized protein LOC101456420 [Ceratitis capitata]CAD7014744.1 unnamed protein product [Ceratitis capitata]